MYVIFFFLLRLAIFEEVGRFCQNFWVKMSFRCLLQSSKELKFLLLRKFCSKINSPISDEHNRTSQFSFESLTKYKVWCYLGSTLPVRKFLVNRLLDLSTVFIKIKCSVLFGSAKNSTNITFPIPPYIQHHFLQIKSGFCNHLREIISLFSHNSLRSMLL